DDCALFKSNGCGSNRVFGEVAPSRIPGLADDLCGFLPQDGTHQIEVMDRHIDEERLPDGVVLVALLWGCISVAPKINGHRAYRPKCFLTYQIGYCLYSGVEAVVLADHQDTILLPGNFDDFLRFGKRWCKRLFHQHMLARFKGCQCRRNMSW